MKLQIDTNNKTITIEEAANLGDLFCTIKRMFPQDEWVNYRLIPVEKISYWVTPVTVPPVWRWDQLPWWTNTPIITCHSNKPADINTEYTASTSSVYNILI